MTQEQARLKDLVIDDRFYFPEFPEVTYKIISESHYSDGRNVYRIDLNANAVVILILN